MKNNKKKKKHSKIIPTVLIICILLVAGFAYIFYSKLSLIQYHDGKRSDAISSNSEMVDSHNLFDDDIMNVLLIGTDDRTTEFSENARGDTCILLSLNKKTMGIKLIGFERAIGVPVLDEAYGGQWDWLTHTFRYGGADLMMKEIRECFDVDVDRYVRINIRSFMEAIDAIGGVDIELTEEEANHINNPKGTYGEGHIREMDVADEMMTVVPGVNHLNGATAMFYARIRWIDSDWNRMVRRRNVIERAGEQLKTKSLLELNKLLDKLLPLVQTNFTTSEIASLVPLAFKYKDIHFEQMTIPEKGTYGNMIGMGGRSLFDVDFETNAQIIDDFIHDRHVVEEENAEERNINN